MNLICMNSRGGRHSEIVAYPPTLTAREATAALSTMIKQAQQSAIKALPRDTALGDILALTTKNLVEQMTEKGFKIIQSHKLPQTVEWDTIQPAD